MNSGVGESRYQGMFRKLSRINRPPPSQLLVFGDEHPDIIRNGTFDEFGPDLSGGTLAAWASLPATYHNGASSYAFADGHSEIHRWQGSAVKKPVRFTGYSSVTSSEPADLEDYRWHRRRSRLWKALYPGQY